MANDYIVQVVEKTTVVIVQPSTPAQILTVPEYAGAVQEAPMDGKMYLRQSGAWVELPN